jgi:hypothetical protein
MDPFTAYLDIEHKISVAKKLLAADPENIVLKKEVRNLERDYGITEKMVRQNLDHCEDRKVKIVFPVTGEDIEFRINLYEELIIERKKV